MAKKTLISTVVIITILCTVLIPVYSSIIKIVDEQTYETTLMSDDAIESLSATTVAGEVDMFLRLTDKEQQYNVMMSSAYANRNSEQEHVSMQSGALTLSQIDYSIPLTNGSFDIKRIFQSNTAVSDAAISATKDPTDPNKTTIAVAQFRPFYLETYKLGYGWRFSFPILEILRKELYNVTDDYLKNPENIISFMYHSESGQVYSVMPIFSRDENSDLKIECIVKNHPTKDIDIYFNLEDNRYITITHKKEGITYTFDFNGNIREIEYHTGKEKNDIVTFNYMDGRIHSIQIETAYTTTDIVIDVSYDEDEQINPNAFVKKLSIGDRSIMYDYSSQTLKSVMIEDNNNSKMLYRYNMQKQELKRNVSGHEVPAESYLMKDILYCDSNRISHYEYLNEIPAGVINENYLKVDNHQDYEVVSENGKNTIFNRNVNKIGSETSYVYPSNTGIQEHEVTDWILEWKSYGTSLYPFSYDSAGYKILRYVNTSLYSGEKHVEIYSAVELTECSVNGNACTEYEYDETTELHRYKFTEGIDFKSDKYCQLRIKYDADKEYDINKIVVNGIYAYVVSEDIEFYEEEFKYPYEFWDFSMDTTDTQGKFNYTDHGFYSWLRSHSELLSKESFYDFVLDTTIGFGEETLGDHTSAGVIFRVNEFGSGNNNFEGYYARISPETDNSLNSSTIAVFKMTYYGDGTADRSEKLIEKKSFQLAGLGDECDSNKTYPMRIKAKGNYFEIYVVDMNEPVITFTGSSDTPSSYKGRIGLRTFHRRATFSSFKITTGDYTTTATKLIKEGNKEVVVRESYDYDYNVINTQTDYADHTQIVAYEYDNRRLPKKIMTYECEKYSPSEKLIGTTKCELYTYDEYGNLLEYHGPGTQTRVNTDGETEYTGGKTIEYEYDEKWFLPTRKTVWQNDTSKTVTDYVPTGDGNLIANETVTSYVDDMATVLSYTEYEYDSYGRITQKTVFDNNSKSKEIQHIEKYDYSKTSDGSNKITKYEIADFDDINSSTYTSNINNVKTEVVVDPLNGNILKQTYFGETESDNIVTEYSYDSFDRLTEIKYDGDTTNVVTYDYVESKFETALGYNDSVNPIQIIITDQNGTQSVTTYDAYGRDIQTDVTYMVVDADGNKSEKTVTTSKQYDDMGNLVCHTDGNGATTEYTYDDMNRVSSIKTKDVAIEYEYGFSNYNGENVSLITTKYVANDYEEPTEFETEDATDVEESTEAFEEDKYIGSESSAYDVEGRLVYTDDGLGNKTVFEYDYMNNKIAVTNANEDITAFEYDGLGRLTKTTKPTGDITKYTYNTLGNVTQKEEGGMLIDYEYDTLGRVVRENAYNKNETEGYFTSYEYNRLNLTENIQKGTYEKTVDGDNAAYADTLSEETVYTYGSRGRVESEKRYVDETHYWATYYEYDIVGNLTAQTATAEIQQEKTNDNEGVTEAGTEASPAEEAPTEDSTESANTASNYFVITRTYDYAGRVLSETSKLKGSVVSRTEYEYDDCGNLVSKTSYAEYNADEETYSGGMTEHYEYDCNNRIVNHIAANGIITEYEYDARGNVIEQYNLEDGEEKAPVWNTYDVAGRLIETKTRKVDSEGKTTYNSTLYEYDSVGNMIKVVSPLNTDKNRAYTMYEYDAQNRMVETTVCDKGLNTITYEAVYDARDNVVYESKGGVEKYYTYDACNNLICVETGNGDALLVNNYDGSGRIVSTTDGNNNKTQYEYYLDGNLKKADYVGDADVEYALSDYSVTKSVARDRKGNEAITTLNGLGLPVEVIYPDGTTQSYTYDMLGRVLSETNQEGTVTGYTYDIKGNLETVTITEKGATTAAKTTKYSYTDNNLLETETIKVSGKDYTIIYVYDEYGKIVETRDNVGSKTTFEYNGADKIAAKNVYYSTTEYDTTTYEYDVRLNVVKETIGNNSKIYTYNAAGACSGIVDFDGSVTTYKYNSLGKLMEVMSSNKYERYSYDNNGNITNIRQRIGTSWPITDKYEYDAFNNVIKHTSCTGSADNVTTYEYDVNNNLIKTILPEQQPDSEEDACAGWEYTYDEMNRQIKATLPDGQVKVEYVHDSMGRVVKEYKGAKSASTAFNAYKYDIFGNITEMTNYDGSKTTYTYDERGNMLSSTDARGNATNYSYTLKGITDTVTYSDGGKVSYVYDKKGRVTEEKILHGVDSDKKEIYAVTQYEYNAIDKPTKITYPDGGMAKYTYDGCGHVTEYVDPEENKNTYTYSYGLLDEATEYGVTTTYYYDAQGKISQQTVGDRSTYYDYDNIGQLICVSGSDGSEILYTYDGNGNKTAEKVLRGENEYDITTYTYDENNRMTSFEYNTDPVSTVSYEYDEFGRLKQENNNGRITAYEYDVMDRIVTNTMPDGGVVKYWYDANGNVIASRDAMGNFDCYSYDSMNRIKSTTDSITCELLAEVDESNIVAFLSSSNYASATKAMQYMYDYAGNVLSETNANGKSNTYTYDLCNRVVTITMPDGTIASTKEYDYNGNVKSDMDAKGNKEIYDYTNNRLVSVTDREGNEVTYTYNNYGETVSVTDALGNETTYEYDNGGRLSKVDSGLGVTVEYEYDEAGNALTQTDGEGHVTEYTYYPFGRMKTLTNADGNIEAYEYDEFGNVVSKTDGNGEVIEYSYNTQNLLTGISVYDNITNKRTEIIQYAYDNNGNRTLMDDESGVYAYTYDARDRLLTVKKGNADYLSYEYDIVGNLSKMYAGASLHSSYTYDANSRVTKVNDITYTYDNNGNLASITTDAGTTAYTYNKNNAVTKVTNTLTGSEEALSEYSYTYYANGNQATKTDKNGVVTTYVYDAADRLVKVSKADLVRDYTYDNAGNRVMLKETYPVLAEGATRTETLGDRTIEFDSREVHYLYTKANVLTTSTEVYINGEVETGKKITRHTFDKAGNEISTSVECVLPYVEADEEPSEEVSEDATDEISITSVAESEPYGAKNYDLAIEVTINEYNALNQLVGMSKIKNGKRSSAEYVYDGDGLRVSKTINDDIWKNTKSVGSTWIYVYSGKTVIGMTDGTTQIAAMYIGAFGCQQIDYASGESEYNFTNAHGDVTNTVKADGTILNTFDYDEFGNLTTCQENKVSYLQMAHFRYSGEYYDIETGNYYLKARYYNPSTGRFTQADTFLGNRDNVLSLNRYTYCHNNPIMYIDPTGHNNVLYTGLNDDYSNAIWNRYGEVIGYNPYGAGYTDTSEAASSIYGGREQAQQQIYAIDPMNQVDKAVMYSQSTGYATLVPSTYVEHFEKQYWVTGDTSVTVYDRYTMASGQIPGRYVRYALDHGLATATTQVTVYSEYDRSEITTWAEQAIGLIQNGKAYSAYQVEHREISEATRQRWAVMDGLWSIGINPLRGYDIDGNFVNYLDFVMYYQPTMKTAMRGNAGRVSDNRTVMLTTILKGMGFNITNNSVYDSWATLAAVDAIQRDYHEITNGNFYDNLINLLSLMPYDSNGNIKSALYSSQAYYKNSLITGQKNWEAEQRRIAEQKAAEEAALKKFQLRNDYRKMITNEGKIDRIHATNEANKAKSAQMSNAPEEQNMWSKALDQIVRGNYSDEVTWLGTCGEIALGFTGIDFMADGRDVLYDLQNWEWTWAHFGKTVLDGIGLVPVVGSIKYADEAFELGSALFKNGDELAGAAGDVAKNAGKAGSSLAENADEIIFSPINPSNLSEQVAESFSGATFTKKVLSEDTTMYRVYGGNSGKVGSYMTKTPQSGGLQSQLDLALNPQWGNTTESVTQVVVPKGTTIYEGVAASQNIYDTQNNIIGTLPGGGNQVYIPEVNEAWFK